MKNKILMALMMIAMTTLFTFLVSGVLDVPVTGGNYSTTMVVNCTQATLPNIVNASVRRSSSANGGAVTTVLIETLNTTDVEYYNSAVDISGVTDGIGYNLTCIFYNSTAGISVFDEQVAGVANITIDNTLPTLTITTSESEITYGRVFSYSITMSDALTGLDGTETCNILNPYSSSEPISTSASNIEYTTTSTAGDYNISCTATDYASNVQPTSTIVKVKTLSSLPSPPTQPPTPIFSVIDDIKEKLKGLNRNTWIVIAVIVGIVIYASSKKR